MKELSAPIRSDRKPLQELLPLDKPLRINIDPSDLCNFKCDFCFQSKQNRFHGQLMTEETFERIIEQLKEFDGPITVAHLYDLGEPLVNKNIAHFIRRLREEKVVKEVKIVTNGSLLTPELIDDMLDAGLDELMISLNGLKDEDFVRVANAKVDFNKLVETIKYLEKRHGSCHTHIKIIGEYFTEEEQKFFVETFEKYTDTINIDGLTNHWSGIENGDKSTQQYDVDGGYKKYNICSMCFYELAVHSNGTVSPCAADWRKDEMNLGNIYDSTLKEIWNSELRKKMMIGFLRGDEKPYIACRECEYASSGVGVDLSPYREDLLSRYV